MELKNPDNYLWRGVEKAAKLANYKWDCLDQKVMPVNLDTNFNY